MAVVNLKISKLDGLTRIRQARVLCDTIGIVMTREDSWGGDIASAIIDHLAQSTPTEFLFTTTDFNSCVTVSTADGVTQRVNERISVAPQTGVGVRTRMNVLGEPIVEVSK